MNLLPIIEDPAFMQQTDAAIRAFCKEGVTEVTYVEHGADNIVAVVNRQYVFRFPRSESSMKRLYFETALLQKIGKQLTVLTVPELVQVHTQPFYSVSKYIEGDHLTGAQVQQLTQFEQAAIGQQLANFIAQLNHTISGLEVRRLRNAAGVDSLDEPWEAYFDRLFVRQPLPNEKLGPLVTKHYALWKEYVAAEQRSYAIHDDLHQSNLLFIGPTLHGVLDFGDANIGGIEEEMRWLYAMGDVVLKSAIEHYRELTGTYVDYNHAKQWAIVHELSSYVSRLAAQDTQSFPFQRAEEHLRAWLPEFPL